MKQATAAYQEFVTWVQADMNQDRVLVNRKVFSVVFWCLIFPAVLLLILYGLRKFQWVHGSRYFDTIVYLPPFFYALYSLWPTLRELPRVFRKGGLGAILEESAREVDWRERTATRLQNDIRLTQKEWSIVSFHLEKEISRVRAQNSYMTILSAVVLFFMFQFLDLGGSSVVAVEAGPAGMVKSWVEQFAQWGIQVFSLMLFSALFYLSGSQFQRYLRRYAVCVERVLRNEDAS